MLKPEFFSVTFGAVARPRSGPSKPFSTSSAEGHPAMHLSCIGSTVRTSADPRTLPRRRHPAQSSRARRFCIGVGTPRQALRYADELVRCSAPKPAGTSTSSGRLSEYHPPSQIAQHFAAFSKRRVDSAGASPANHQYFYNCRRLSALHAARCARAGRRCAHRARASCRSWRSQSWPASTDAGAQRLPRFGCACDSKQLRRRQRFRSACVSTRSMVGCEISRQRPSTALLARTEASATPGKSG